MTSRRLDFPIFDADNHMYEPPEALTRHLPERYANVIQYVQVKGRTKIAVKGRHRWRLPKIRRPVRSSRSSNCSLRPSNKPRWPTVTARGAWATVRPSKRCSMLR